MNTPTLTLEDYKEWLELERNLAEGLKPLIRQTFENIATSGAAKDTIEIFKIENMPTWPKPHLQFSRGTSLKTLDGVALFIKEWLEAEGLKITVEKVTYRGADYHCLFATVR